MFAYSRQLGRELIYIVGNFSEQIVIVQTPTGLGNNFKTLIANMDVPDMLTGKLELAPYQASAIAVR